MSGVVGPTVGAYWVDRRSVRERKSALAEKDLHELRTLFADCLKLMLDARLDLIGLARSSEQGLLDPVDADSEDEATLSRMLKAREGVSKLQTHIIGMQQDYPRLVLMLGADHPAGETFLEATNQIAEAVAAPVQLVGGDLPRVDTTATLDAGVKALGKSIARFIVVTESVAKREPADS